MTTAEQEALLLEAFLKYRTIFVTDGGLKESAPYNQISTREAVHIESAVYHEMLCDHARHLANDLNGFGYHIAQLDAWSNVLSDYNVKDQLLLFIEFVDPLATTCVNYPYALQSRFIFSVSHLSHQANLLTRKDWSESRLPVDRKIISKTMLSTAGDWFAFAELKTELERLCDASFAEQTYEFRHKYHHRFPPCFEHGRTQTVSRIQGKDDRTVYDFGYVPPLSLKALLPLLTQQHKMALLCFEKYSNLAREQLHAIYRD